MFFAPAIRSRSLVAPRSFDQNFERFLNESFHRTAASALRVQQDEKAWTLGLDLPGVAREQLAVNIEGAIVRIETAAEAKRQFKAAYELPEEIDVEASSAKMENGVLELTLVKKVPVSNARSLEIR